MTAGCSVSRCENTPSFHVAAARQRAEHVKWSAGVYAAAPSAQQKHQEGKPAGPEGRDREVTPDLQRFTRVQRKLLLIHGSVFVLQNDIILNKT